MPPSHPTDATAANAKRRTIGRVQRSTANAPRWTPATASGHYESYFTRANHPHEPVAWWLRYTVFAPAGRPADAVGELWAAVFDGRTGQHTAAKSTVPAADARFAASAAGLDIRVGTATMTDEALSGEVDGIRWELAVSGGTEPLLLLPERRYAAGFPKAKALVPVPFATFDGFVDVRGERYDVRSWVGSQNHNWGARHTDEYAWGQVAGFDDAPDVFLECSTARVRIGGRRTPWLTPVVVRHDGRELRLNAVVRSARASARYTVDDEAVWEFRTRGRGVEVEGAFRADRSAFVELVYDNPPGGTKTCLNTKIAAAELTVRYANAYPITFRTVNRAAFEILS
jgi:hypothetical protein